MEKTLSNFRELKTFEKSPELAEVKVSYRQNLKKNVKISSPEDSFEVLYQLFDFNTIEFREEFFLLLLNRANFCLGWFKVSSGGTSGTVVDVKIIYMLALLTNASSIILCHNHPSQNIRPSDTDIALTNQIKDAGKLFGINVLDHLIVASDGSYFAFASGGLL